jgi:signal transduction histidine kinase
MRFALGERALATALVVPTAIAVITLAVVQYRWSNEVRNATSIRLADSLQMSMTSWQLNLFRDLADIGRRLPLESTSVTASDLERGLQRFFERQSRSDYPDLVAGVLLLTTDTRPSTRQWNASVARFEAVDRAEVGDLPQALAQPPTLLASGAETDGAEDWRFDPRLPGLVHRLSIGDSVAPGRPPQLSQRALLAIQLDLRAISSRLLPALASRYFSGIDGLDYQVAVVQGTSPRRLLYSSDPSFAVEDPADADGRMNLFGHPLDAATPSWLFVFHPQARNLAQTSTGRIWFPLLVDSPAQEDWRLVVRHRRGGALGAFVDEIHRRDLTISLGLLLLLIISMIVWTIISARAQRLATVQLNFVTAVSHDLRTPLAIITSAADNIARGVVHEREQLGQYGTVIVNQAKRLTELVEQVLLFASTKNATHRTVLQPVDVAEVIGTTLAASADLLRASRVRVDTEIESSLPSVMADPFWVSQCLQNLVTNALKYGGEHPWLGIRAALVPTRSGAEIQISVADRGIGIAPAEIRHIFRPFYRSPDVLTTRIQGTGLGLAVARNVAEGMNGRLSVSSDPGLGSTFTLHLPCDAAPGRRAEEAVTDPARPASSEAPPHG